MTVKKKRKVSAKERRRDALWRYIVFRIKAIEFLDLNAIRMYLIANANNPAAQVSPSFRPPLFASDSIRTVVLSWFALFIDKNGMDVTKLWIELFPHYKSKVEEARVRMAPAWDAIREFRDSAGFHADSPRKYFGARHRIKRESQQIDDAVKEFESLFKFFLKAESAELPDLEDALDSLVDELERAHDQPYQREQFKAYLMIPLKVKSTAKP